MAVYSSLTDIVKLSPNYNDRGNSKIKRFTPHCIVGQCRAIEVAGWPKFNELKIASANYIIGRDGELLCNVSEDKRAWTSGGKLNVNGRTGKQNDYEAITIECASDAVNPYAFNGVVYDKLIQLCVDICKRYNKTKVVWIPNAASAENYAKVMPDNELLITVHRWYASASCPGDWLYNRLGSFADTVNRILQDAKPASGLYHVQLGAFVNKDNAEKLAKELQQKGYDTYVTYY